MKVNVKYNKDNKRCKEEINDVEYISISIGDIKYNITKDVENGLLIRKADFDNGDVITIIPAYANVIKVK